MRRRTGLLFATGAMVVAVALPVFVATAVAARPCGRAVIDDWYDIGTIDRSWDCGCLRDAIDRLPDIGRPYSPARDDVLRQFEVETCEGSGQVTLSATLGNPRLSPGSDKSITVTDDLLPWDFLIVGGIALGLAALVGVALYRRRLLLRRSTTPGPDTQGEEHEILMQQRQAQEEQQHFVARLQRHSGNLDAPFLQDPFDPDDPSDRS